MGSSESEGMVRLLHISDAHLLGPESESEDREIDPHTQFVTVLAAAVLAGPFDAGRAAAPRPRLRDAGMPGTGKAVLARRIRAGARSRGGLRDDRDHRVCCRVRLPTGSAGVPHAVILGVAGWPRVES